MDLFIILFTVLLGSLLTFFSGFGLGTILLPVFTLFFSLEIAIGATAIVHFFNSFFKVLLVYRYVNWKLLLRFGSTAIPFAFMGAWTLGKLDSSDFVIHYNFYFLNKDVSLIQFCIGVLMLLFASIELFWKKREFNFSGSMLYIGGLLSGFFGGLSGHQGALRAMFLTKINISKEEFVATSSTIGLFIDFTRLVVYSTTISIIGVISIQSTLIPAICVAFVGSYFGSKLLGKTTMKSVQYLVTFLLFIMGLLLVFGFL